MGVTSATLSLGTAAYPVVVGYLAAWHWNAPFLVYALALPVAGVVLYGLDGRAATGAPSDRGYLREAIRAVPTGRALGLYGVMFGSFVLLFGGVYTALPFYLADAFGFETTRVGLVTSGVLLVTVVVSTANGRLAAHASATTLLAVGFVLYALGFLGVAVAETTSHLVASLLVFGGGSGLITPTLFATISSLAPDHVRAGVMSLQTTTIGASQTVGPALFTLLGGTAGYRTAILGASGGAVVAVVVVATLPLDA
jgi:MFS family permease